ncbi:OB-fold nucleic acid binding domain-containing protein, partial [Haemophilus influenzae]
MSEQEVKELDLNGEMLVRREKLAALRTKGNAFPNKFRRDALAQDLHNQYDAEDGEILKEKSIEVQVAGRIMTRRAMGKATFITIQDMSGKIQLYVARDNLPEGVYAEDVGNWDLGDIIGVKGTLFKTKTNELTIKTT